LLRANDGSRATCSVILRDVTSLAHPPSGLSKATWTDDDYDSMGWHDCTIHALRLAGYQDEQNPRRLVFDLDYIVRWVEPARHGGRYTFWIAPATLVFEWPIEIRGEFALRDGDLELADLHRLDSPDDLPEPVWRLEGHDFDFYVRASGYRQFLRTPPQHVSHPSLAEPERGGVSFAEQSFQ
jgi:hypothetical protein